MEGLFSRLSLRSQAALAVVLPCVVVAVFTSIYFPQRLNQQATRALEQQVESVGRLAVVDAAPTIRLIRDGLVSPDELKKVFDGVHAGGGVETMGAVIVSGETVKHEGDRRVVEITS